MGRIDDILNKHKNREPVLEVEQYKMLIADMNENRKFAKSWVLKFKVDEYIEQLEIDCCKKKRRSYANGGSNNGCD